MIDCLVMIRGAGDLASGTAVRLHNAGFPVVMLEVEKPTVIRRTVSFADALLSEEGTAETEGVKAEKGLLSEPLNVLSTARRGTVAVVADSQGKLTEILKPSVLIDAIIAKKNLGTRIDMAPFTIALGPGFVAGKDVHVVIETQRGHNLGRIITEGSAAVNTGVPGLVNGYGKERVIHSSNAGVFKGCRNIGDLVEKGEIIGYVDSVPVRTKIAGKLRGLLADGIPVTEHFKLADVDPRGKDADHTTCSDKAMAVAGGVLEAVMNRFYGWGK